MQVSIFPNVDIIHWYLCTFAAFPVLPGTLNATQQQLDPTLVVLSWSDASDGGAPPLRFTVEAIMYFFLHP